MSIHVLSARFEAYKQECALDRLNIASELKENRLVFEAYTKEMNAQLENRVTFKHFYWIVGIALTILLSVFGFISAQLKDLSLTTSSVQQDVASLKGKLSPYEIEFVK